MSLVLVGRYTDPQNRLVLRFHAPSSTEPGKVYTVDNLAGTDVWTCGPLSGEDGDKCEASRYKKTCRHIPNWREPPKGVASITATEGDSPFIPGEFHESTVDRVMTLREMISGLADKSVTFRDQVIKRMSGPIVVSLLAHYHGLRIIVPEGHSMESYLMSLPQFSTIRTASLDVLKEKQAAKAEGWEDDGTRAERNRAYRDLYAAENQGTQMTWRLGA